MEIPTTTDFWQKFRLVNFFANYLYFELILHFIDIK